MAAPLAGLGMALILTPPAWGAGSLFAPRLNVFLAFLTVASLRWRADNLDARMMPAITAVLCVLRVVLSAPEWRSYEKTVEAFRGEVRAIEPGQRALVIAPPSGVCAQRFTPFERTFLQHLANFAIIDRRAMASTLFTGRGMQPVRLRDKGLERIPWDALDARLLDGDVDFAGAEIGERPRDANVLANWRNQFDVVIAMHGACSWRPTEHDLSRIASGDGADIYAIAPGADGRLPRTNDIGGQSVP